MIYGGERALEVGGVGHAGVQFFISWRYGKERLQERRWSWSMRYLHVMAFSQVLGEWEDS